MTSVRKYEEYEHYLEFQKKKTTDPVKRKKWLNEEWDSKIDGFKNEFSKLKNFLTPEMNILCLGARTGQEVQALRDLGCENAIGIDIVPTEPLVIKGDIHDLQFENESMDLIYSNIIDHALYPAKMISEIERVLKPDGLCFLQFQLDLSQDEFTEFVINNPAHQLLPLFDCSWCVHASPVQADQSPNFAGMNFEVICQKSPYLTQLFTKYGNITTTEVPPEFIKIWNDINAPIQKEKLDRNQIFHPHQRKDILSGLKKRAYYLTRVAEIFGCKNIAEVGTAEGWQFYSFCEYAQSVGGKVYSCDPRDVRHQEYAQSFENEKKVGRFVNATSREMSEIMSDIDLFYIDGLHDPGAVSTDVKNLVSTQSKTKNSVWVFDDFDIRFGCFQDILSICLMGGKFKVCKVGTTASGAPSHQAIVWAHFSDE
jgi:SAM-dependent methyltransferase